MKLFLRSDDGFLPCARSFSSGGEKFGEGVAKLEESFFSASGDRVWSAFARFGKRQRGILTQTGSGQTPGHQRTPRTTEESSRINLQRRAMRQLAGSEAGCNDSLGSGLLGSLRTWPGGGNGAASSSATARMVAIRGLLAGRGVPRRILEHGNPDAPMATLVRPRPPGAAKVSLLGVTG